MVWIGLYCFWVLLGLRVVVFLGGGLYFDFGNFDFKKVKNMGDFLFFMNFS